MEITYTTTFVRKERPGDVSKWEDEEVVWYECPNCGEECDAYSAEERGHGVHTITECFETMRERIKKGEELLNEVIDALVGRGVLELSEPEPRMVDMGKRERYMTTPRPAVIQLEIERKAVSSHRWQQSTWLGSVEQLAARIKRSQDQGMECRWDNPLVARALASL